MSAQRIEFPADGRTAQGYLATPARPGPAVIVLQEWWGLVPHIEDVARRLAAEGFLALAPDLYEGRVASGPDEAGKLMMAIDIARTTQTLGGALRHLLAHPLALGPKAGVVGFCMGGQLALYAGCALREQVGAVVDFYGIHPAVKPDLAALEAPVLGFFAEQDRSVPPPRVHELEASMRSHGKRADFEIFPGVGHAFFNDTRPDVYHAETARHCWLKLIAFLRESLG